MLTEVAWAATRTKDTFYSARYHRLAARRGKKRALIAIGHSILKTVYHVIKGKEEYRELGASYLDSRIKAGRKAWLKKELEKIGFQVSLTPSVQTVGDNKLIAEKISKTTPPACTSKRDVASKTAETKRIPKNAKAVKTVKSSKVQKTPKTAVAVRKTG